MERMVQHKLNAIGQRLQNVFKNDDVDIVLLLKRKDEILCTSNVTHDDVCEIMQEFINSPTEG
jgi:hypothetical protein